MKSLRLLVTLVFISSFFLGTAFYACKKDRCKDIQCLNNGICDDGTCKCATGFYGKNCELDSCSNVVCLNGGVCDNGKCLCPLGFEGKNCETLIKNKFLGVWHVTEDGTFSNATQYMVAIENTFGPQAVIIKNFRNRYTSDVFAFVWPGDTIRIPRQILDGDTVSGIGALMNDAYYGPKGKIVLRYSVKTPIGILDDFGVDGGEASIWNK